MRRAKVLHWRAEGHDGHIGTGQALQWPIRVSKGLGLRCDDSRDFGSVTTGQIILVPDAGYMECYPAMTLQHPGTLVHRPSSQHGTIQLHLNLAVRFRLSFHTVALSLILSCAVGVILSVAVQPHSLSNNPALVLENRFLLQDAFRREN